MERKEYIGAVIALVGSGTKIGPYFIGQSLHAIQKRFGGKINPNLEIIEVDIIHIKKLNGYKKAWEKLNDGDSAAIII